VIEIKRVIFKTKPNQSYIKSLGWPPVKSGVKLPLIVPLSSGKLEFAINEANNTFFSYGTIYFISDKFVGGIYNINGNVQTIAVVMHNMEGQFDPGTGLTLNEIGFLDVVGQPGTSSGAIATWYKGDANAFLDGNSLNFDISNGLGCAGGLVYEVGTGNPTDFIVHIEASVDVEDANGDGIFETACPDSFWGEKKFELDYKPPEINWIFPQDYEVPKSPFAGPFPMPFPTPSPPLPPEIIKVMKFTDLWKLIKKTPFPKDKTRKIDRIKLVGAQNLLLLLLDSDKNVIGGSISDKPTRIIKVPPIDVKDLYVTVLPNPGVATIRTQRA
jgi:hypothetical protein